MEYRMEHDSMGEIRVPADKYWGAQTERSHNNFPIGVGIETMPAEIVHAFGILKKAAARANRALRPEKMTAEKLSAIEQAADEVISGKLLDNFPLVVWQTGSGTQSNMNSNEVIANRGNEIAGKKLLHPNDDINMSQSSNDTFPTAMHIAAVCAIEDKVIPAIDTLTATFRRLEEENAGIVKSGRTHLQDATPISFPQEISGWRSSLERDKELLLLAVKPLKELALGGTAVGTGLNTPKGFDTAVAAEIAKLTGKDFKTAENKFHALTSKDEIVFAHGALKALAAWYRGQFRLPVVQVTGSVGKTTTKEMIAAVLTQKYETLRTEGNLNNDIGAPLTLLRLMPEHEAAVIETGMNHFGEIRYLGEMVRPDIAVITNVGDAHIENLGNTRQGILQAKCEIFENLTPEGVAVLNGDDELLNTVTLPQIILRCGEGEHCDVRVTDIDDRGLEGMACTVTTGQAAYRLETAAPGRHMVYPMAMAAAIMSTI